jgi:hypothetical protein
MVSTFNFLRELLRDFKQKIHNLILSDARNETLATCCSGYVDFVKGFPDEDVFFS